MNRFNPLNLKSEMDWRGAGDDFRTPVFFNSGEAISQLHLM